jgi:uncharacterized protein YcgI (DUF1989 family)
LSDVITVAGGHGAAFIAKAGQLIRLIDVEGQQAVDFVALCPGDPGEYLSGVETRRSLRSLYIKTGDVLVTNRRRPMLRIVEDTIGVHDYTIPACDRSRYEIDFGVPGHRNCLDNMYEPLRAHGLTDPLQVPEPFNFFQNSPVVAGGGTAVVDPPSRPGDMMLFECLIDVVCAVSSCPQDIIPGNGLRPSAFAVKVEGAACHC